VFKAVVVVAAAMLGALRANADEPPLRDPMRPPGADVAPGAAAAAAAGPRFALTAVLVAPTRRVAIVNGKPYFEGETIDGAEIVAIELDSVRVREDGAERVITLRRPEAGRQSVQGERVP
jgi:hypothetical protein